MRIDQLLVQRGLASTRSQAQRLIAGGVEWQQGDGWRRVAKNGDEVAEDAPVRLLDDSEARYVSRGGLKLEAALQHVGLSVTGFQCLDVGQSTGGFTDCLLQQGAVFVVGVDVGSAQLHPKLHADPRVLCVEGVNARALEASDLMTAFESSTGTDGQFDVDESEGESAPDFVPEFDLVVADLSFISQTLVLPAVVPLLKTGGTLLTLVKPQFELQPGQVGKGGIVKDADMYRIVEQRLREACAELGLKVTDWFDSPISGGDGNREFFICATKA
ncbi:TlyA family RNA methyltransferase [Rhodoferax sp.]|uniref:TlyA family RNA methyltransferase n=1 Tax=Rhodoferax sp. TaxID=50421 RepID=UPI0008C4895E|nr:TlyA family RNA methyltransferase [Rhodoferax sp.]MDO8319217.1 TlyA family RNA methyltransferase [Rhodoferax sp.]MDP2678896.1 TlyA family RNA methyltransferase [Rhodoferax sp.]OGB39300.1 MAG: hemolysin [Burkholderiales bacterium RIFOXYC2_FULL_59_8]OGB55893.1 MAG: hemolysin [Burkholderiales bacterium RIFOXYD12_FULL_59_19]